MASQGVNDVAEASAGARLTLLLAAVQGAADAAASLRACAAAAVALYGWRAGLILSPFGQGLRVADPEGDVIAARAADRRRLTRWAETEGAEARTAEAVLASLREGFGPLAAATVPVPAEGGIACALQFLADPSFAVAPDFAETLGRVAAVAGLRLACEESSQRFADLAGWVNGTYWEMDENLRYTRRYGVEAGEGVPPAREVIGRTRWELAGTDVEDEPEWRLHREQLQARRPFEGFEYEAVHDGVKRSWRVAGHPVFDRQGAFRGYRGVSVDVTVRHQSEERLKASERRFERFTELTSDWLWEMGEDLRYTWVSPKMEALLGEPATAPIGKHRDEISRADLDPEAWRRHLETLRRHEPYRDFIVCRDLPAGRRWIRSSGIPLFDDDGHFKGYMGTGVDVTGLIEADRAADRARELLQQAIESISQVFSLWDADDRLVLSNARWRELHVVVPECARPGASFAEVLRASLAAGLFPDAVGREAAWFRQRMARHRKPGPPFEVKRQDGRWTLVSEQRLPDGATVVLATDVSELKRAEAELRRARDELERRVEERTAELEAANRALRQENAERERVAAALRESEERFRAYAESSADWFWEMDGELRFTYMSPNVERILGVKPEWHYGKSRRDIFGAEHVDASWAAHLAQLDRHEAFRDFVHYRLGDGKQVKSAWLSASGVPRFDDKGRFLGYRGSGREVTAAIESQRKVRDSEAQLRLIADNLPVLIAYVDAERRYAFVNRVAEQWLANRAENLLGRSVAEVVPAAVYDDIAPRVEAALSGRTVHYERRITFPDGVSRDIDGVYVPDVARDGEVRGYIVLLRDVSEQRASEAQLRQAQKMDAMGQLTGGIAHDFNNLLTVILGSLDLLALEVEAEAASRAYLDEARHAVAHGSLLTQHLLAFARRQALSPRRTNVNALIASFAPILQRTLGARIEVVTELDPALWPATVDRVQLENVLLNLALNARDASPSGGRIGIATGNVVIGEAEAATLDEVAAGAYVRLSLRDEGEGMAPEVLAHAVEPFFTTKEVGMGSGLGLSMVFGYVKQSHGHMQIDSAPGAGTTVTLYLPRAETPAVAVDANALS